MNPADDQRLRQRLGEELGALEISPAPVLRVTGRGQGIRTRRRAVAAGAIALVVAGGALSAHVAGGRKARPPTVTVSAPDPAAPGRVFASGTADGKPWNLAVRNIAADPGTSWCLPAVMFNGRYGNVLYRLTSGAQPYGYPAYLAGIPGFPGVGAIFTQVQPGVTKVTATLPGGRSLTVRPVAVSACTQRFLLAGFAFANAKGVTTSLTAYFHGMSQGLDLAPPGEVFGQANQGVWANTDNTRADNESSGGTGPIGTGTVGGQIWHIRTSLGLYGQCYTATMRGGPRGGRSQSSECMPVAAPPRVTALDWVPITSATMQLSGYAGLVNPRATKVVVSINNGTNLTLRPVLVAGRAYIAFAVPPGCRVHLLGLYDAAGHMFATTSTLPPPK